MLGLLKTFALGNIMPLIIGGLVLTVGAYVLYLRHDNKTLTVERDAWKMRAGSAESANAQVAKDVDRIKGEIAEANKRVDELEKGDKTKRERLAGDLGKANVQATAYKSQMERLQEQAKIPAAKGAELAEIRRLLFGIAKARQ